MRTFDYRFNPPLLFVSGQRSPQAPARLAHDAGWVELFVANLEAFAVPDADLPRIAEAVQVALQSSSSARVPLN